MRERIGPWIPAIFCGFLVLIVLIGNTWAGMKTGNAGAANPVFMAFMPICFVHVGMYLSRLRNENKELRNRLDAISSDDGK